MIVYLMRKIDIELNSFKEIVLSKSLDNIRLSVLKKECGCNDKKLFLMIDRLKRLGLVYDPYYTQKREGIFIKVI